MANDVKKQSLDPSSARRFRESARRAAEQSRYIDTTPSGGYGAIAGILAPAAAAARAIPAIASGVRSWALSNDLVRQLAANEAAAAAQAASLGFGSRAAALTQAAPKVGGALSGAAALSPAIQSLPSTNKPNNAPGGFVPEAPDYYFNAGRRFDNPTQAFMAEAAAERQMVEALSGHMAENQAAQQARVEAAARQADEDARAIQSGTPRGASLLGLNAGEAKANEQNQRGFLSTLLGNVDWQGLLSVMARPEFLEPGVSPAVAFSKAAFGQRQAEAAAAAAQQQQIIDLQKEAIKATPQPPKASSEITQLYTKMASGQESLRQLSKMQGILSKGITTGGAALGIEFIKGLAAAFNINIGETDAASLDRAVTAVRTQLIAGRAFGREATKYEQKLIDNLLPKGSTFTNVAQLENAYNDFKNYIENDLRVTSGILQNVYGLPSYSAAIPERNPTGFTRGK